ncbi:MAG: cupin domain-containing protein [Deltaproteobacteria bacterium]|nr:cupin domain-containing protein [Candidatus Zymogenaceae bacterium]
MEVFNRGAARNTGALKVLTSYMLISPHSSSARNLSIQISDVPVGSGQPTHKHAPEQCYYIVRGEGLMIIGDETRQVCAGDAVYIPPDSMHGITNIGDETLEYLTANSPAFDRDYEDSLWPSDPRTKQPE